MASVDSWVYNGDKGCKGVEGGPDGGEARNMYEQSGLAKIGVAPVSVFPSFAEELRSEKSPLEQRRVESEHGHIREVNSMNQDYVRMQNIPDRLPAQSPEESMATTKRQLKAGILDDKRRQALKEDGLYTSCCPEYVLELARKYQIALNDQNRQMRTGGLTAQDRDSDLVRLSPRNGIDAKDKDFRSRPINFGQQRHLAEEIFREMNSQNSEVKVKKGPPSIVRSPSGIKNAILRWCQMKTRNYPNVNITNFSSSWADGMAFCALIHHFCPDAFDFNKLNPTERAKNLSLAFKAAEEQAGIVPLLEVEDMLLMGDKPDYKCIFTYVQSIFINFRDRD